MAQKLPHGKGNLAALNPVSVPLRNGNQEHRFVRLRIVIDHGTGRRAAIRALNTVAVIEVRCAVNPIALQIL